MGEDIWEKCCPVVQAEIVQCENVKNVGLLVRQTCEKTLRVH